MHPLNDVLHWLYVLVRVTHGALVAHRYTYAPPRCRTFYLIPTVLPFILYFDLLAFFLSYSLCSACFCALFQSFCSNAQVFWSTLVHEFHIFYSHTELNLISPLKKNYYKFWKLSAVNLILVVAILICGSFHVKSQRQGNSSFLIFLKLCTLIDPT